MNSHSAWIRPVWTRRTDARLLGLSLAREAGLLLSWDAAQRVVLWDLAGQVRARNSVHFPLAAAAISDDGSRIVLAGAGGELWWLNPELRLQLDQKIDSSPLTVALDPLGLYAAVSSDDRRTRLISRSGAEVCKFESPRPLVHLLFLHTRPLLVAAADYGFVAAFDPTGNCLWRHAPVSHVGSLHSDGVGDHLLLASFSGGIERCTWMGQRLHPLSTAQPCRLALCDYNYARILMASESATLALLNSEGRVISNLDLSTSALALVLDALGNWGAFGLADGTVTFVEIGQPR